MTMYDILMAIIFLIVCYRFYRLLSTNKKQPSARETYAWQGDENKYREAKEIFMQYDGSAFHMAREEIYDTYKKHEVPKALEEKWLQELKEIHRNGFLQENNASRKFHEFSSYGEIIVRLADRNGLLDMLRYVQENAAKLDSFTLILFVDEVIFVLNELREKLCAGGYGTVFKVYKTSKTILEAALQKPIWIAPEHIKSMTSEFCNEEIVVERMKDTLNTINKKRGIRWAIRSFIEFFKV